MKKGIIAFLIAIGIMGLAVLLIGNSYNSLVELEENVEKEYSNISVMLERRADLIPNLVETVKGYAAHEEAVINSVTEARQKLLNANTLEEKGQANNELTSALNALMIIVENYPELKANTNFIQLSDELAGTENRIANARNNYNDAVKIYNSKVKKFPTNILANMFGFEEKEYFEVDPAKTEVPKVEF